MDRTEAGQPHLDANLEPLCDLIVAKLFDRLRSDLPLPIVASQARPVEAKSLAFEDAAARLQHSYSWLSRNYRRLGLRPSRIGGKLLFRESDIEALMARQKVSFRGRPSKIKGDGTLLGANQ